MPNEAYLLQQHHDHVREIYHGLFQQAIPVQIHLSLVYQHEKQDFRGVPNCVKTSQGVHCCAHSKSPQAYHG
jgi:hypothetical protein